MTKEERLKIYKEIQEEIQKDLKTDISVEEIHSVINSQFKILAYGFSKGVGSHLPYIGKFIPFDMDYFSEKVIIPNKEYQQELKDQGLENEAVKVYKDSLNRYKKIVSEIANQKEIPASDLVSIPNVDGITDDFNLFKNLR